MDGLPLFFSERFSIVRRKQVDAAGVERTRDVLEHPGSVVILPLLPNDQVCLIKNFRAALQKTILELPAGTLDPGEDPRAAAERELAEETGFRAEDWRHAGSFFPAPGILSEEMHLFVAQGLTAGEAAREPGEWIENLIVHRSDAIDRIRTGQIRDAKTIIGLLNYDCLAATDAITDR